MKFGGLSMVWTCKVDERLLLEVGEGYLYPFRKYSRCRRKRAVGALLDPDNRSVMTPDNPVCSEEIPAPLDEIQPGNLLSTWGPDI